MRKLLALFLAISFLLSGYIGNSTFAVNGPVVYPWNTIPPAPLANDKGTFDVSGQTQDLPSDVMVLTPNNFTLVSGTLPGSSTTKNTWLPSNIAQSCIRGTNVVVKTTIYIPQGKSGDYQIASTFTKTGNTIISALESTDPAFANWSGYANSRTSRSMIIKINDKFIKTDGTLSANPGAAPDDENFVVGYNVRWGRGTGYNPAMGTRYDGGFLGSAATKYFWDWSPIITLESGFHDISVTLLSDSMLDALVLTKVDDNYKGYDWTKYMPEYYTYGLGPKTSAPVASLVTKADVTIPIMENGTISISNITDNGANFVFPAGNDANMAGYQLHFHNTVTNEEKFVYSTNNSVFVSELLSGTPYDVSIAACDTYGNLSTAITSQFTTTGRPNVDHYFLSLESFIRPGTWRLEADPDALIGTCLIGLINKKIDETRPAISEIDIAQSDTYNIWVRAKDYPNYIPGQRNFQIGINGETASKIFGKHNQSGYLWELAGSFFLSEGINEISLVDTTAYYPRCDGVFITKDLTLIPPSNYSELCSLAAPFSIHDNIDKYFPEWANSSAAPVESTTIQNDKTKVIFYKVPTENGNVVQNEIYVNDGGTWVKTNKRDENLGYLVLRADTSQNFFRIEEMASFNNQYTIDDQPIHYLGVDIYKSGEPIWMIPTSFEPYPNGIKLNFSNERINFSAIWELVNNEASPKVSIHATFNEAGSYSIGVHEGKSFADSDYEFAMAPFRVMGKRVSEKKGLIIEQYAFTPMGTVTLPKNNEYIQNKNITKGVVVDPSWIPLRWVYSANSKFGIGMRNWSGETSGSIFAPLFGTNDSRFSAGESFQFNYRIINDIGDWFDSYKHVAQGLFNIHDYRQNTYASLNDAIFNTRNLMMDDVYSGWDVHDKAHYNMEGKNQTSSANPMQALQVYLLTENKDVLTKRAIPTIANTLTRKGLHFNRKSEWGGVGYWETTNLPNPIGSPISGYNLNVIGGMYEMTRGAIPYLYQYGVEKGKTSVTNAYGSVAPFSNNLNLYKYTGDIQYLNKAIQQADEYLAKTVYAEKTDIVNWSNFIYISYYPNLASLVDIYEVTKEQRYLDAAKYVAQWITTCLWVPGIDGDKLNQPIEVNNINDIKAVFHYGTESNVHFWWYGDKQFRIGRPIDLSDETSNINITNKNEEVPAWIPSRVGLGIEQASTFGRSSNIIMSSWVGDLLKVAQYSGETYFSDVARNAVIGHFANYSGYYQNAFITYQQYPQFPIEGPDYTGIYWHHIPPFLAMLEDFLINMTAAWSNDNIHFPSLRQQGYAYFNSNQYGFESGKFFDQNDMWLWLDEGVLDTGNIQIDWLGAKKDGVVGFALLNESNEEVTTTVSLGEKVAGGMNYTGKASLFDKDSNKTEIQIISGSFEISIPAKSLKAITINLDGVKAPAYSTMNYNLDDSVDLGKTVAEHSNGKAYVLQMTPDNYYAYVYIIDKPEAVKSLTMKYIIGNGEEQTVTTEVYPYEFIIEVENPNDAFLYSLEIIKADDSMDIIPGGELKTLNGKQDVCGIIPDKVYHISELPLNITFSEGSATLDGQVINSGYHLMPENAKMKQYTLIYTDALGVETIANFRISFSNITIDNEPIITNIGTIIPGLLNHGNVNQNVIIAVAAYKNNKLIEYKTASRNLSPASKENVAITFDNAVTEEGVIYKYFIWDTINGLKPLL